MNTKQYPFWFRFTSAVVASLMVLASTPVVHAIDIQAVATDTRAGNGFTHRARIQYTDLTNSLIYSQFRIFPGGGTLSKGDAIDRVAVYLDTPFYVPNANAGSNSVFLNVGRSDVTNSMISNYEIGSNALQFVVVSNQLAPMVINASSNFVVASITHSNAAMAAATTSGDVYIWLRVIRFDRLSTP